MTIDNRNPHPIDKYVGNRIRLRRRYLGKTQSELAQALDLSFQQIQKYERGANRISASKLLDAAKALGTPISYFFDGFETGAVNAGFSLSSSEVVVNTFLTTDEGLELAVAFPRVKSPNHRRKLLALVHALAQD